VIHAGGARRQLPLCWWSIRAAGAIVADWSSTRRSTRGSFLRVGRAGTRIISFAELFKSMTGIEMAHVPYRGTQPGLNDVVAGHMPLMFTDVAPAIGMLQAERCARSGVDQGPVGHVFRYPAAQ